MEPWQERVVVEREELEEKIQKLEAFIRSPGYASVLHDERYRLHQQMFYMGEYSRILADRIAVFKE